MTGMLHRLLKPKSVAVIGGKEANAVIAQAEAMGFDGEIWPVHPGKNQVGGLKVYRSVADLPGVPDAAFIAVNRERTIGVVADLAALGAGGAICYASGFRETDAFGQDLEQALIEAAGDMPVIGPNCYGLLNYVDGVALWPDQHGGVPLAQGKSGVAIIAQSSNIAINLTMQQRALPISYMLTVGNQAQTGMSELAMELLDDDRVSALGLYIEGFDSIVGMETVARKARQLGKPIVAMKIGASAQGRRAALSHTAAVSSPDNANDAFLKRLGIARVKSLPSFLETLKFLHVNGTMGGYALSSLSCSGGEAGLMADGIMGRKIYFRDLTAKQKRPVQQALGNRVTIANPLDYHTYIWGDRQGMEAAFTAMLEAQFDLGCLVMDFPHAERCSSGDWQIAVDAWAAAIKTTGQRGCIVASLPENISESQAESLIARGIAPLIGISEAFDAIEAAAEIGAAWKRAVAESLFAVEELIGKRRVLDEFEGKKLLSQYGVEVPRGGCFNNEAELLELVKKTGFPVALKVLDIAHKTEQNAVVLNLGNIAEIEEAISRLKLLGGRMYIEAMVQKPVLELLVGVIRDEQFGLVMTIATGGVLVEVFDDSQTLLLPFEIGDVEDKLRQLKSARLFEGFRGREPADFDATVQAILSIQTFAMKLSDQDPDHQLVELDINPLIVCEQGCGALAADVLIRV